MISLPHERMPWRCATFESQAALLLRLSKMQQPEPACCACCAQGGDLWHQLQPQLGRSVRRRRRDDRQHPPGHYRLPVHRERRVQLRRPGGGERGGGGSSASTPSARTAMGKLGPRCTRTRPPQVGGAIMVGLETSQLVDQCAATQAAPPLLNVRRARFVGNVASDRGGALAVQSGAVDLQASTPPLARMPRHANAPCPAVRRHPATWQVSVVASSPAGGPLRKESGGSQRWRSERGRRGGRHGGREAAVHARHLPGGVCGGL